MTDGSQTAQELRIAVGRLARRLRDLYAGADADREPSFSEISVLSRLHREGPSTPGALSDSEHVTPQAIGNVLATLEDRGLVTRRRDPTDGRRVIVAPTAAGRRALDQRSHHVSERLARAMAEELTDDEVRHLAAAVPLLERLAGRL